MKGMRKGEKRGGEGERGKEGGENKRERGEEQTRGNPHEPAWILLCML